MKLPNRKVITMKHLTFAVIAVSLGLAGGAAIAQDCPADLPTIEPGKLTMSINATLTRLLTHIRQSRAPPVHAQKHVSSTNSAQQNQGSASA